MKLLRDLGIAFAGGCLAGLLLAFAAGRPNFLLQIFAASGAMASIFCGYIFGQYIRATGKGRGRLVIVLLTLGAGVMAFIWGLASPPVIGQSESWGLFPGMLLIGAFAGMFDRGR